MESKAQGRIDVGRLGLIELINIDATPISQSLPERDVKLRPQGKGVLEVLRYNQPTSVVEDVSHSHDERQSR